MGGLARFVFVASFSIGTAACMGAPGDVADEEASLVGSTAVADACVFPRIDCAGICANLAEDPHHCGACGATCAMGDRCTQGLCVTPELQQAIDAEETRPTAFSRCGVGSTHCGGGCVDLRSDDLNCAGCGLTCSTGTHCRRGHCL